MNVKKSSNSFWIHLVLGTILLSPINVNKGKPYISQDLGYIVESDTHYLPFNHLVMCVLQSLA
mgnify:FL=1